MDLHLPPLSAIIRIPVFHALLHHNAAKPIKYIIIMHKSSIALLVALAGIQNAGAYSVEKSPSVSRRESFARVASTFGGIASIAASAGVLPANALPSYSLLRHGSARLATHAAT